MEPNRRKNGVYINNTNQERSIQSSSIYMYNAHKNGFAQVARNNSNSALYANSSYKVARSYLNYAKPSLQGISNVEKNQMEETKEIKLTNFSTFV